MRHVSFESFAKEKLGGEVFLVWERLLEDAIYSRWERTGILPTESCVVGIDDGSGPYAITDDIRSVQRFLLAANHRFLDVDSSIALLKGILPHSRQILFDDPEGFMRQFIDSDWKSPTMENGVLTFYCNDSGKGIVERWTIEGCQLKVEDFAPGRFFAAL